MCRHAGDGANRPLSRRPHRRLIRLDRRGTGRSARPEDSTTYRCDRLADDVEALRRHLGLDRIDLLAHSADANPAVSYVSRHPERVGRLALMVAGPPRAMAEVAGLFLHGRLVIQPGTAHFPWLDDGPRFAATVTNFLKETETL
ncbi:alpha/beta fold hydrolase [Streptomyces sp. NPDC001165]|uniref:alpha/beta fold hydrolase n=1 Tax=Streptomyces sp. NPDC001165 TaxID=3364546 RepID=UPI0036B4FA15